MIKRAAMAKDRYEDKGLSNRAYNWVPLPGGTEHVVKDNEKGTDGRIHVHDDQKSGDAIKNGQWNKKP